MTISANQHAIGALKLTSLHLDHPGVVPATVLRDACADAIALLRLNHPCAADLGSFFCSLLAVTPRGYMPYVTLTTDPATPYACVITDADGNIVDRQLGKTIEGITEMIRLRHTEPSPARTAAARGEIGGPAP
jgi:hypothetical protein